MITVKHRCRFDYSSLNVRRIRVGYSIWRLIDGYLSGVSSNGINGSGCCNQQLYAYYRLFSRTLD